MSEYEHKQFIACQNHVLQLLSPNVPKQREDIQEVLQRANLICTNEMADAVIAALLEKSYIRIERPLTVDLFLLTEQGTLYRFAVTTAKT